MRALIRHYTTVVLTALALLFLTTPVFAPAGASVTSPVKVASTLLKGSKWERWALPDLKISELAEIARKPGGTIDVGKALGKMTLSEEVLEDTYARILIAQGRVQRNEAEGWMRRLSGTPGFRTAMRKSSGASDAMTVGHRNEIRIADNAVQLNCKVKGIGVPFNDPNKKGLTDIDVLLDYHGREVAIEAKYYPPTVEIPLDTVRADMRSLAEFRRSKQDGDVLPVFWISHKPNDPLVWQGIEKAAKQHDLQLIVGLPDEAIHLIPRLLER